MVDILLELAERWPKTGFVALSRHGLLPETHLTSASAPSDDGAELFQAMCDKAETRHWMRILREAVETSKDWRTVVDSLRSHTPKLWKELAQEERARFLRHARWAWERARHRMPPSVARDMAELERHGRLQRLRGLPPLWCWCRQLGFSDNGTVGAVYPIRPD